MKVKDAPLVLAVFLSLTIIAGSLYSLPPGLVPDSFVSVGGGKAVLRGTLKVSRFPVERFGPAPQVGDTRRYMEIDVLVLDTEAGVCEYLLYYGGRTEMVPLGGGNLVIGGLTLDEINGAYKAQAPVEVTGAIYKLTREGRRYDMIRVESIEIPDRSALPLVIYHILLEAGRYAPGTGITDLDAVILPTTFHVGRNVTGVIWKDTRHVFRLLLSAGDRVRLSFGSHEPIDFKVYAPSEAYPESNATRWGVQVFSLTEIRSLDYVLEAGRRGTYNILFEADSGTLSAVELNASRLPPRDEPLFTERGYSSSSFGGMGSLSIFPKPIPKSIVIGRAWSMSGAWADTRYNYTAYLEAGTTVRLQYNATKEIKLQIKIGGEPFREYSSRVLDETVTMGESGYVSLVFAVEKPATAIVSARCLLISGNTRLTTALILYPYREGSSRFPPSFNSTIIEGKLATAAFPMKVTRWLPPPSETTVENTTVLAITTREGALMYLHLGVDPELIPYPEGGYTRVGNLTLYDVVAAYDEGLRLSVEGFTFTLERSGEAYSMFHVNSIRVEEPEMLPLNAEHSWDIVIGRNTHCYGDDVPVSFPVSFSVGFDSYEEGYGYPEHFYHVYLFEGETIQYHLNATSQIEFRAYVNRPRDTTSVIPFSVGKPEQYFITETVAHAEGYHKAKASGYVTFAFKAWSGENAEASFNCVRVACSPLS
ncbi:MAG: hypothetical protein ABIJ47_16320 [Candidatus Bathyarchaeota archaeon]